MIWLNAYFLADMSPFMIKVILIIFCFIVASAGIKHMAIASGFILPTVMILGFFIAFTNTNIKEPSYLLPVLSQGYMPIVKGIVYTLSGVLEIFIVILLQPFSQKPIKFYQLFILFAILFGLILGPLTAAIMEFGPTEAANFRYPAYEQWRVLNIGEYISHLDFFALYQWLSGACIRIGLFIYLIGTFFTSKKKHHQINPVVIGTICLTLFGLMLINVETYYFYRFIHNYFLPACMVFFLFQIIVAALIVLIWKKRIEQHGKNNNSESSM